MFIFVTFAVGIGCCGAFSTSHSSKPVPIERVCLDGLKIVTTVKKLPDGRALEGKFLSTEPLCSVAPFEDRYDPVPHIFIRPCYNDLYEIESSRRLGKYGRRRSACLFTGVPGIGKSMFLPYFLFRFLNDPRFPDKEFAFEFTQGQYNLFQPTEKRGEFDRYLLSGDQASELRKDFLLLSDIRAEVEPMTRAWWTCIFSSPNDKRYKETMKDNPRTSYTMPTWSDDELHFLDREGIPDNEWQEKLELVGGVPRLLLRPSVAELKSEVDMVIDTKGKYIIEELERGKSDIDMYCNYLVTHINPKKSEDGEFIFESKERTFATDCIETRLHEENIERRWDQASKVFDKVSVHVSLEA